MDDGDQDYIFFGTPIEREEELSGRKRKMAAEAGQMRSLPPWKQEVRDDEGRKRFHGAFTGGFSAGYYNTVGSKEGWTPQTFTSSRKNRAEMKEQTIYNFLDDDEKVELEGRSLGMTSQFDTFGFTTAEVARKQVEKEQQKRPSAIPGPVPDEIVVPAPNSIGLYMMHIQYFILDRTLVAFLQNTCLQCVGIKLLLKMGWRHGRSIGAGPTNLHDTRREARKAFLAFSCNEERSRHMESRPNEHGYLDSEETIPAAAAEPSICQSTPEFVRHPKRDIHGLGYDPYKHAPEFRESKRLRGRDTTNVMRSKGAGVTENIFGSRSRKIAPGIGIGALEELDVEDEDIYASGFDFEETPIEVEEPMKSTKEKKQSVNKKDVTIPGFRLASVTNFQPERFLPPVVPSDFEPHHKFPVQLEGDLNISDAPPLEVPPPEDNELKRMIDGMATLVARCGRAFEYLSRERNEGNPLFSFLCGGDSEEYYRRRLWEEQRKHSDQLKLPLQKKSTTTQKMSAESRGRLLGERPLERGSDSSNVSVPAADVVRIQSILSDTFTKPASLLEVAQTEKPFKNDPAKQERFEQFLKDKYHGGLRSTNSGGMSELHRAQERLDFEAAAETIEKGGLKKVTADQLTDSSFNAGTRFTSGGIEKLDIQRHKPNQDERTGNRSCPKREEYQWRPAPILCKRFDLLDPFAGKPPPLPRIRSKMDSFILISHPVHDIKDTAPAASKNPPSEILPEFSETNEPAQETAPEPNVSTVQKPVDLYKAIFSDDSDDENNDSSVSQIDSKKTEVVNTTLNRLIAGDFLESLGKELGLEVPRGSFDSMPNNNVVASGKEHKGLADVRSLSEHDGSMRPGSKITPSATMEIVKQQENVAGIRTVTSSGDICELQPPTISQSSKSHAIESGNSRDMNLNKSLDCDKSSCKFFEHFIFKSEKEKRKTRDNKSRGHKRHGQRSCTSDTDSSDCEDQRDQSSSETKREKKGHGKRRKHSKNRKKRRKTSRSSSPSSDAEWVHTEYKRDKISGRQGTEIISSPSDRHSKYYHDDQHKEKKHYYYNNGFYFWLVFVPLILI
ncbi:hypothetical protein AMTRI_Chr07g78540 [Amborella trichopoda]